MTMGCCGNGLGFSLRSTRSRRDEDDSINQEPTPIDQYLAMRYTADLHTLLSSFSPVVASWTAAENGSGPSQLGLTGRLYSTAPSGGGFIWSTSRKELEIAVALEQADEQLHRLPKCTSNDWNSVAVAEERLLERLYKLKLDMQVMQGDGNCQFRSISQGLYGTQQYHLYVRQKVVGFMERHAEHFSAFLGQEYSTYVSEMSNNRVWGDELTLRAACEAFGVVVNVVTSDTENWFLRYIPQLCRCSGHFSAVCAGLLCVP